MELQLNLNFGNSISINQMGGGMVL